VSASRGTYAIDEEYTATNKAWTEIPEGRVHLGDSCRWENDTEGDGGRKRWGCGLDSSDSEYEYDPEAEKTRNISWLAELRLDCQ
jgi:hypothetical protein